LRSNSLPAVHIKYTSNMAACVFMPSSITSTHFVYKRGNHLASYRAYTWYFAART